MDTHIQTIRLQPGARKQYPTICRPLFRRREAPRNRILSKANAFFLHGIATDVDSRRRHEETTGCVSLPLKGPPNSDSVRQSIPTKRSRLSSTHSNKLNSEEITLTWVNGRLSMRDCAVVESILTKFESKGTRFREYFYWDVLQSLDLKTCAHIMTLWMRAIGSQLPNILNSWPSDISNNSPMESEKCGVCVHAAFSNVGTDCQRYPKVSLLYFKRKPRSEASIYKAPQGSTVF